MIWGMNTSIRDFKIFKCPKKMNSKSCITLLKENVFEEIIKYEFKLSEVVFMQDNASCHVSQTSKKWFKYNNINLMEWPAQDPDMNPIENFLDLLDNRART